MISMFPEFLCHTLHIATFFSPCCNRAALDHGNHQKPISRLGQRGFSDLQDQLCLFGRPKLGYTNQSKSSISAPKCWDISHLQSPALVFLIPEKVQFGNSPSSSTIRMMCKILITQNRGFFPPETTSDSTTDWRLKDMVFSILSN